MYKNKYFFALVLCSFLNLFFTNNNVSFAAYDDYADYANWELNNSSLAGSSNNNFYFKKGNTDNGKEVYKMCVGCHLSSGAGKSDGSFPQLAGQYSSVIIKQLEDIKSGLRDNPTMYPFAASLTNHQDMVDLASYLENLCQPLYQGKYSGSDKNKLIQIGENLYQDHCISCHKAQAQGDAKLFYPKLAGQHYNYLLRQITLIQKNVRRNADPDMQKILQSYNDEQVKAVSVYISELPKIGNICKK